MAPARVRGRHNGVSMTLRLFPVHQTIFPSRTPESVTFSNTNFIAFIPVGSRMRTTTRMALIKAHLKSSAGRSSSSYNGRVPSPAHYRGEELEEEICSTTGEGKSMSYEVRTTLNERETSSSCVEEVTEKEE